MGSVILGGARSWTVGWDNGELRPSIFAASMVAGPRLDCRLSARLAVARRSCRPRPLAHHGATIVPALLAYALLGTSRQLVVGPDTATGLISAVTVGAIATQGTAEF